MIKSSLIIPCILLCFYSAKALDLSNQKVETILQQLDQEINKRHIYINEQQLKIDSLKNILSLHNNDSLITIMEIGDEYVAFENDSAISYYDKGYNASKNDGLDSIALIFRLKRDTYLPLAGIIDYAASDFESIDSLNIPTPLHELYYESGKQMYSYIASCYTNYPTIFNQWKNKSLQCQLKLLI